MAATVLTQTTKWTPKADSKSVCPSALRAILIGPCLGWTTVFLNWLGTARYFDQSD